MPAMGCPLVDSLTKTRRQDIYSSGGVIGHHRHLGYDLRDVLA